jgi:hypothetical protein
MRLAQCDHEDGIGHPNCLAISTVSTAAHARSIATAVSIERAPEIVEAILDGKQPKGMQLEELTGTVPSGWEGQRASVGVRPAAFVGATLVRSLEA